MSGRTRRIGALLLTGLMTLQGCGSTARRGVEPVVAEARLLEIDAPRTPRLGDTTALAPTTGGGLQPTCGIGGWGFSRGEGAALIGFLILASPFLVVYAVLSAPVEFLRERM